MTFLARCWRVLFAAVRHFMKDHARQHAAAVAYYALLTLAPGLYLFGRVLATIFPEGPREDAAIAIAPYVPPAAGKILEHLLAKLPRSDGLTAVAVPILLWVATTTFSALEVAVNDAFGTTPKMRFWLSRAKSFLGVSLLGFVLVSTLVLNTAISRLSEVEARFELGVSLAPATAWLSYAGVLALSFGAFTLLYKVLPRGKVRWSAAAPAAGVAVVLWEAARHVFGGLVGRSPTFGLLTGVLAASVSFLVWVYTGVAILLLGAEVAAVLNGNRPES